MAVIPPQQGAHVEDRIEHALDFLPGDGEARQAHDHGEEGDRDILRSTGRLHLGHSVTASIGLIFQRNTEQNTRGLFGS